jgi:hypothetical protein
MEEIRMKIRTFLITLKIKGIKVPKYLIFHIISLAGYKYALDLKFMGNEDLSSVAVGASRICNLELIKEIIQTEKSVDYSKACFIAGYYGYSQVIDLLSGKMTNVYTYMLGYRYGHKLITYDFSIDLNYKQIAAYKLSHHFCREFRGICFKNNIDVVKRYFKKELVYRSCYECYQEGFYGACESGNLDVLKFLIGKTAVLNKRGLEIAKKCGQKKIIDYYNQNVVYDNSVPEKYSFYLDLIFDHI